MSRPTFTLVAGANGSGKSTLTRWNAPLLKQFPVLDPDTIVRAIQAESHPSSNLAAGRRVLQEAAGHLLARRSFAVETTLSGHNYLRMMLSAHDVDFEVALIYIGTTAPEVNVDRVADRVLAGGHNVPEDDIRRRYHRSLRNLPVAISRADRTILFDNSTADGYELVALIENDMAQWFRPKPNWAVALRD